MFSIILIGLVCFTPTVDCIHLGAVSGAGQTGIRLEIGLDNFFLCQNELESYEGEKMEFLELFRRKMCLMENWSKKTEDWLQSYRLLSNSFHQSPVRRWFGVPNGLRGRWRWPVDSSRESWGCRCWRCSWRTLRRQICAPTPSGVDLLRHKAEHCKTFECKTSPRSTIIAQCQRAEWTHPSSLTHPCL